MGMSPKWILRLLCLVFALGAGSVAADSVEVLRNGPTRHAGPLFTARACRAPSTRRSLVP